MSTELVHTKLIVVALAFSVTLVALLLSAISFEFFAEEMAKIFVVPILVASTLITALLIGTLVGARS